jgi:hypothetical protein
MSIYVTVGAWVATLPPLTQREAGAMDP